uniref:Uncharacterized protein n=1 Tax=Peronospora matthiolae TaxID=2874970 RepID=A0AAV1VHF3_9STRA
MFSSWDLVRPRFWYPMSSLEQSMMELEHMSDSMMRPCFPFGARREMLATPTPKHVMYSGKSTDDDDFFVDLPVVAHKYKPTAFQPVQNAPQQDQQVSSTKTLKDDDPMSHSFSSYSFSSSSVMDDKGRRVTTTRRRYEDSTGHLKAVHEREIDGKKMRTTWRRQGKGEDEQHESIFSSGSPEEFEALWQQTPFGAAQKTSVKGQLQAESEVDRDVTPSMTPAPLADTTVHEKSTEMTSTEKCAEVETEKKHNL